MKLKHSQIGLLLTSALLLIIWIGRDASIILLHSVFGISKSWFFTLQLINTITTEGYTYSLILALLVATIIVWQSETLKISKYDFTIFMVLILLFQTLLLSNVAFSLVSIGLSFTVASAVLLYSPYVLAALLLLDALFLPSERRNHHLKRAYLLIAVAAWLILGLQYLSAHMQLNRLSQQGMAYGISALVIALALYPLINLNLRLTQQLVATPQVADQQLYSQA